jgi:tetratricopeptide (TPR) repeat protein
VRRRLLAMSFLGFLLLFSSLTAPMDLQETRVKISPEQDRYSFDIHKSPVFTISAKPNCAVCVEVTNDSQLFMKSKLRDVENFFSSFLGSETVEGTDIDTDEEGNAEYTLAMDPWNILAGRHSIKLYYRALVIDPENSNREEKQLTVLASSLKDSDWQKASYIEVFSSSEEEIEYDMLEEARVPYQKGQELYKQKKYEAALEEFLKAKEIVNRGNIEYWLSYSYLQLALECAKRALGHPTSSEKVKREIKHIIDLLEPVLE